MYSKNRREPKFEAIGTPHLTFLGVEIILSILQTCSRSVGYDLIKDYNTLGVLYWVLQARVHEQETRNLTLHEAQPSAVLNFEFLVRERVELRSTLALNSTDPVALCMLGATWFQTSLFACTEFN